jgi:hypothetical protein
MQHVVAACPFKAVKLFTTDKHATTEERSLRRLHIMTLQKGEKFSVRRARKSLPAKLRAIARQSSVRGEGRKLGRGVEKKNSWIHGTEGEAWYSLHLKGLCHEMNIFVKVCDNK